MIDNRPPADIKLTRLQRKALRCMRENPGASTFRVATAIGHRPHYTAATLDALARLRWIDGDRSSPHAYSWTWTAREIEGKGK